MGIPEYALPLIQHASKELSCHDFMHKVIEYVRITDNKAAAAVIVSEVPELIGTLTGSSIYKTKIAFFFHTHFMILNLAAQISR